MREAELSVNFNSKSLGLYDKIFTTSDIITYFKPTINKYNLYLLFILIYVQIYSLRLYLQRVNYMTALFLVQQIEQCMKSIKPCPHGTYVGRRKGRGNRKGEQERSREGKFIIDKRSPMYKFRVSMI